MRKFFTILLVCLLALPTLTLAGCKNSDNASSVKNNIYYVTKVMNKGEDVSKTYTDNSMRIIFYEDTFMAEYSTTKNTSEYGYYLGTFKISENMVTLTVTEAGGTYENYSNNPSKKVSVFSSLRYSNGKLYTEFPFNGAIHSFTLTEKDS